MSIENGSKQESEFAPRIAGLEVWRRLVFTPLKTYGNVSPEEEVSWPVDDYSLITSEDTKNTTINRLRESPELLVDTVTRLINTGVFFESLRYAVPVEESSWIDGELSAQRVKETIFGIGAPALPVLEVSKEKYARELAGDLRRDMRKKEMAKTLHNIWAKLKI